MRAGHESIVNDRDADQIAELRRQLAARVGRDRFEVWFGASTQLKHTADALTVTVPNRFFQDWLRSNFRGDLEAVIPAVFGSSLAIEFRVDASLQPADAKANGKGRGKARRVVDVVPIASPQKTLFDLGPVESAALSIVTNGHIETPVEPKPVVTAEAPRPRAGRKFNCLPSFVVGDSNRLAHQSALMAANQPGTMSPLFVYGATGVGKTHLLEGIWTGIKRSQQHAPVIYLSAEQFTSQFQEALRGSGLPSFRRKVRGAETLIIDDVQFFLGKKATVGELLHTIETLMRDGKQVVLAADRPPSALKGLGPELAARITSGVVCKVDVPEFETRLGIVQSLATKLQIDVPREVQVYVASQFVTHARELAGALKRLHAMSLAHERPITLQLAEETLTDLMHHHTRVLKLADIDRVVCEMFGLENDSLKSDRKTKNVAHPRMLAMWLARKHTRAALSEIGHHFGHRTHSTVISAQQKIDSWMSKGISIDLADRSYKLEDAIRRVEEALQAG